MSSFSFLNLELLKFISILSALLFILSIVFIPYLILRLPSSYFVRELFERPSQNLILNLLRYIVGFVLIIFGLIMLVTPGQGLISILLGITLIPSVRRNKFIIYLISLKGVQSSLNFIRVKFKKEKFHFD